MKTADLVELTACEMETICGGVAPAPPSGRPLRRLIRFLLLLIFGPPDRASGPADPIRS
jgi:hypothetical protein